MRSGIMENSEANLKEIAAFEESLVRKGYVKYTTALSSSETYGYFKTLRHDGATFQVEVRFWDWTKYNIDRTMSLDVILIGGDDITPYPAGVEPVSLKVEMMMEEIDVDAIESLAPEYVAMLRKLYENQKLYKK